MCKEAPLMPSQARKPTNISLDPGLLTEVRALKINLSRATEEGVSRAVRQARADQWLQDSRQAIASSNLYVEDHGLPLVPFRPF